MQGPVTDFAVWQMSFKLYLLCLVIIFFLIDMTKDTQKNSDKLYIFKGFTIQAVL